MLWVIRRKLRQIEIEHKQCNTMDGLQILPASSWGIDPLTQNSLQATGITANASLSSNKQLRIPHPHISH